jgi:hypothetical protein
MSKLTTATELELETLTETHVFGTDDVTADSSVSRWDKKGDRLYINAPIAKLEKYKVYVDLEANEVHSNNEGAFSNGGIEIDGDTVTVTIIDSTGIEDREHTLVLTVEWPEEETNDSEDNDAEDSDGDDENNEATDAVVVMADGGEDHSDIATDAQIQSAIEHKDDPEHPDCTTVDEVRDVFATIQRDLANFIEEFDEYEVAYEGRKSIVYIDPVGDDLGIALDEASVDDEVMREIISVLMHELASTRSEFDWSASWPVVIRKPLEFRRGETHALRSIADAARGTESFATGVDFWACEVLGQSRRGWSLQTGRSEGAAATNLNRR